MVDVAAVEGPRVTVTVLGAVGLPGCELSPLNRLLPTSLGTFQLPEFTRAERWALLRMALRPRRHGLQVFLRTFIDAHSCRYCGAPGEYVDG